MNTKDINIEDTITITRKITLIPATSDRKEWHKKVYDWTVNDLEKRISFRKKNVKNIQGEKEEKEKYKNATSVLEEQLEDIKNGGEFTRKIVNDYTYGLVRTAMEEEARRKNYILSWIFSEMRMNRIDCLDIKDQLKFISDTINAAYRISGSKKGSIFDETDIPCMLQGYGVDFKQELTRIVKDYVKKGGMYGRAVLPQFKLDSPFTIEKTHFGFEHEYSSYEELCEHIHDSDCKIFLNYGGSNAGGKDNISSIARFQVYFGSHRNRDELMSVMLKVLSGEYQYCGSSIQISGNKIILNLSMKIPKIKTELDEHTVVGVDLGVAIPAMCALNNNPYKRQSIGKAEDFVRVRNQLQAQRRRLQKSLKDSNGGHGRSKKLTALERISKKEQHFAETYCHMVSKRVVDFAVANKAKYINLENLTGYDSSDYILSNWSFYRMQQYITYKAERYGIVVRKINPCYTSQVCSVCGHYEEGQRTSQSEFHCGNPDCASNNKKGNRKYLNADFNAARNIAKSELFMESGEVTEASKEKARKYYNIPAKEAEKAAV